MPGLKGVVTTLPSLRNNSETAVRPDDNILLIRESPFGQKSNTSNNALLPLRQSRIDAQTRLPHLKENRRRFVNL